LGFFLGFKKNLYGVCKGFFLCFIASSDNDAFLHTMIQKWCLRGHISNIKIVFLTTIVNVNTLELFNANELKYNVEQLVNQVVHV
jgi:hypothetical protein